MEPLDSSDKPVFVGRVNLGVVTLNLPMILKKSQLEAEKDNLKIENVFYKNLDYFLEMIRKIHQKTFKYLANKKAGNDPLGFCEGGFLNGYFKPNEKLGENYLRAMTMSFGITALNELEELYHQKSLVEDGSFSLEVMKHINEKIAEFKKEDGLLYAIYGTPAESLASLQIEQFRKKYGIIEKVSDRAYVSNSFHCHVTENITPAEKQDYEKRFWNYFNGGKIQYVKFDIDYNYKALKDIIRRGLEKGFYQGVNLSLSYCEDCGYEELNMEKCPKCKSQNITKINRMNGYLGYTKIHGKTRYNEGKNIEISERKSM